MPRTLYTPRLSDDVVRSLYREAQRRRIPMTRLADELLRQSLGGALMESTALPRPRNGGLARNAIPEAA
ncbi:MAG: hypothetical protein J0M04_08470 [Verrucomicrobia bacterium]|nr:hypothetical protein [Verrucomicrobiota bacterium]